MKVKASEAQIILEQFPHNFSVADASGKSPTCCKLVMFVMHVAIKLRGNHRPLDHLDMS